MVDKPVRNDIEGVPLCGLRSDSPGPGQGIACRFMSNKRGNSDVPLMGPVINRRGAANAIRLFGEITFGLGVDSEHHLMLLLLEILLPLRILTMHLQINLCWFTFFFMGIEPTFSDT